MLRRSITSVLTRQLCRSGIVTKRFLPTASGDFSRRTYYDYETNKNDDGSSTRTNLSEHERTLYDAAKPRVEEYRSKHVSLPDLTKIPPASLPPIDANEKTNADDMALMIRRKRLIYRCMQRGWLEVDLLLGTWASQNVMTLTIDELNEFEEFVNSETIDIYNIITLRLDTLPEKWKKNNHTTGIVERIQEWAKSNPLGRADPEKYKEIKASAKLI